MHWPFLPQCRVPTNSVSLPLNVTLAMDLVLLKATPTGESDPNLAVERSQGESAANLSAGSPAYS